MSDRIQRFKLWIARKTEECKDISSLYSDQMERKLSFAEKLRVRIHLWTCGPCTRYVSNLRFMHEIFQSQKQNPENEAFGITLPLEAKERLKNAIKSQI